MNHNWLQDKVLLFYDDQLPAQDRPAIESHLSECAECRGQIEEWRRASALLRPLRVETSEIDVQRVMSRVAIYQQKAESIRWSHFARWAFPSLAMAVGGFATVVALTIEPARLSATDTLLLEGHQTAIASDAVSSLPGEENVRESLGVIP